MGIFVRVWTKVGRRHLWPNNEWSKSGLSGPDSLWEFNHDMRHVYIHIYIYIDYTTNNTAGFSNKGGHPKTDFKMQWDVFSVYWKMICFENFIGLSHVFPQCGYTGIFFSHIAGGTPKSSILEKITNIHLVPPIVNPPPYVMASKPWITGPGTWVIVTFKVFQCSSLPCLTLEDICRLTPVVSSGVIWTSGILTTIYCL